MIFRFLTFAALLLTLALPRIAPANNRSVEQEDLLTLENVHWRLIEHSPTGLVFEIVNDNASAPPLTVNKIDSHHWIAAPSGSRPTFEVLEMEWEVVWERSGSELALDAQASSRAGEVPIDFSLPRGHLVGDFRGVGLISCRIGIASSVYAAAPSYENGMAVLRRARFAVTFEDGRLAESAPGEDLAERDPTLMAFAESYFLNPGQVAEVSREVLPLSRSSAIARWNRQLAAASERGPIALLRSAGNAWTSIDRQALEAGGVDVDAWDATRLIGTVGNQTVPIHVATDAAGRMTAVSLWVPARTEPGAEFVPVWLMMGDDARPARLSDPTTDLNIQTTGVPMARTSLFAPNHWSETYPPLPQQSRWATAIASPGGDLRVRFDAPGLMEGEASLTLRFGGGRASFSAQTHIFVNGERLAESVAVRDNVAIERKIAIPAGLLHESDNLLVMTFESGPGNVPQERLVLSTGTLEYLSRADLFSSTTVTISEDASTGKLTAPGLTMLDITDPKAARWIAQGDEPVAGAVITAVGVNNPVRFHAVESVEYRDLLAPDEGADMLIIAAGSLRESAEEYAAYRHTDQRRVRVLTMDEINRAFNFGWTTDGAVRSAISQAFAAWPGRRLSQVLLIGEASEYWWQIDHPRDDVAPNMVPVHGYANPDVTIRGDDGHAIVAGAGRIADVEIGRIPAVTNDEVRRILAMVREYESNPEPGAWRDRHLIVTDDEPDFYRVAERLAIGSLFGLGDVSRVYLQEFPYEDYFRIFQRKRSIAATERLFEALNEGSVTATYIGHGAPNIWSPRRLLHMRDIPRLANGARRPLLLAGSCDTAWLDFPIEPVRRSFAERFFLGEDGGAIAVFAPSASALPYEHDFLLRAFFDAMMQHPDWSVGRVALASKLEYMLRRQDPGIPGQYVLIGDPALRLAQPETSAIALDVEATGLYEGRTASLRIRGTVEGVSEATAEVWIEDRTGRAVSPRMNARVRDGRFNASLQSDRALSGGDYAAVSRIATDEGRVLRASERIAVGAIPTSVQWVRSDITEVGTDAQVEVRSLLEADDASSEIVLEVQRLNGDDDQVIATIAMNPGVEANWSDTISLSDGVTVLHARTIALSESGERRVLREERLDLPRRTESIPALDLLPGSVVAQPNGVENITSITLRLVNLTDDQLVDAGAELLLLDGETERRLGRFARGNVVMPSSTLALAYRAEELLPAGIHRARLRMHAVDSSEEAIETISSRDFQLNVAPLPRIEIVPGSVTAEGNGGFRGETIFVTARLRNAGTHRIPNVTARLYIGWPHDSGYPAPSATGDHEVLLTEGLAAGEERTVRLRWDPAPGSPSETTLVVIPGTRDNPAASSNAPEHAGIAVSQRQLPNLALLREEMRLSRELVRAGDVLSLNVPFVNNSSEDFNFAFLVEVRAQGPLMSDVVVLQHELPGLAAGERVDLPVTWRADGQRTRLYAVINEEREFGEQRGDDNDGSRNLAYLLPEKNLAAVPGRWTFAADRHLGTHRNTQVDPGDAITITRRPDGGVTRVFDESMILGDAIPWHGPGTNEDGLMAFTSDSALYWTINETPQNVRLRVPLPDDRATDVMDVYLTQLGPGYVNIAQSNGYRVRFGDGEWISNPDRRNVEVYFGRFSGAEGGLVMEIGPEGDPTWNTLSSIRLVPVQGTYTSPIYELERFPGGRFAPLVDQPPGSTIRFEVRTAAQPSLEPEFTQWGGIPAGMRLPPDVGIRMMQWRVHLGGAPGANPRINDAAFEFAP